jgi:hypothetical protein
MKLNERLGVPEGINKQATDLYKKLFISLDKLLLNDKISIPKLSDDNSKFEIPIARYTLRINNLDLKRIPLLLRLHYYEKVDKPILFSAGYANKGRRYVLKNKDIVSVQDVEDSSIVINVAVNSSSTKQEIINMVKTELEPDTLAHELMHLYDASKSKHKSMKSSAEYQSYIKGDFSFPDIIVDFMHLLYFTTSVENTVRPTELYHQLLDNKINKSQFRDFLKETDVIKKLELAQKFSLERFKEDLNNSNDVLNFIDNAVKEGYVRIGDNAEDILNILMTTIINSTIENTKGFLKSYVDESVSFVDRLNSIFNGIHSDNILKSQEEANNKFKDLVSRYQKYENNPNKYFKYLEKRLNFVGDKMKRKLYKLYDMVEDNKETILNWDIHNKINSRKDKKNERFVLNFYAFKNLFEKVK